MKQYIDKADVIAEIEKRKQEWQYGSSIEAKYKHEECDDILSSINTIEVKEVDLDKEARHYLLHEHESPLLRIMEKENKYNNALEKLQEALAPKNGCEISGLTRGCIEEIFPELKESEDERIRRNIIAALKGEGYYNCDLTNECISWLEKQQSVEEIVERCKNSWYNEGKIAGMAEGLTDDEKYQQGWHDALEKQGNKPQGKSALEASKEEKVDNANKSVLDFKASDWYVSKVDGKIHNMYYSADKVEPKFHEGEWIIHQGTENIYQVIARIDNQYQLKYGDNYTVQKCTDVDRYARLWDITKDAKSGDVLASNVLISKYNKPFIYNGNHNSTHVGAYCGISTENRFNVATKKCRWTANVNIRPATKEQCDKLFKAMADTGYTFDFDKKELKKIEQKPAWKPSGEQMNALEHFVRSIGESGFVSPYDANLKLVYSLLNDLKKLREE